MFRKLRSCWGYFWSILADETERYSGKSFAGDGGGRYIFELALVRNGLVSGNSDAELQCSVLCEIW